MVRSIFCLAAVLSVASASLAGDLVTPPSGAPSSTTAACMLTNITSAPISAQLELWEGGGGVLTNSGLVTVPPGKTFSIEYVSPQVAVYCRFVNASKSKVRGSMVIFVTNDGSSQVVVAAQ
jgi:hypothetical protein